MIDPRFLIDGREAATISASATGSGPPTLYVDGAAVSPLATVTIRADLLSAALLAYHRAGIEATARAEQARAEQLVLLYATAVVAKARG